MKPNRVVENTNISFIDETD